MPVYPCAKCNSPVDPGTDKACKNCREAKPLECSRCHKRIATEEVFEGQKLKTKKPIFCLECGEREEVVKCGLCNLSLQRHQGKQVSNYPAAKTYHPRCLEERQRQLDRLAKFQPLMGLVGLIVGGLAGWVQGGAVLAGGIGVVVAVLFYGLVNAISGRLTPR